LREQERVKGDEDDNRRTAAEGKESEATGESGGKRRTPGGETILMGWR